MSLPHSRAVIAGPGDRRLPSFRAVRQHAGSRIRERGYRLSFSFSFPLGRGQHELRSQRFQLTKPVTADVRIAFRLIIDGRADAHRQRQLNPVRITYSDTHSDAHTQPDSLRSSDFHT